MRFLILLFSLILSLPPGLTAKPKVYPACVYSFDLPKLPIGEIAYINGMNHRPERAVRCALLLARMASNHNIYTIYNPTDGLFGDLKKCYHELYRFKITPPVEKLHERWDDFFAHAEPYESYLQFCHSQGAIQVRNALFCYPHALRKRIIVVAIAPAAYIPEEYCLSVYHYVSRRDIVPYFDMRGRKRSASRTIVLTPHPDARFFDHHFLSPTFRDAIQYHLTHYLEEAKKNKREACLARGEILP